MTRLSSPFGATALLLMLAAASAQAGPGEHAITLARTLPTWPWGSRTYEHKTVEDAARTIKALSEIPLKGIPHALLHEAAGVAIIPGVVKAGLLVDGRFGRGVILRHEPDGNWSNPVFVTLSGGGVGGQVGIEETDLVLVFTTKKSLERALRGKLALGTDVTVAAGFIGRDAEAATDRGLKAEIYSYSRSRGLFAGVSVEGSKLHVDGSANDAFYGLRGCRLEDVMAPHRELAEEEHLKRELLLASSPPSPIVVVPAPLPRR
jgi:lipid-binding SYLF domain-containing protein